MLHTDIEGALQKGVKGLRYHQGFVDEASCDKRLIALKIHDALVEATGHYLG